MADRRARVLGAQEHGAGSTVAAGTGRDSSLMDAQAPVTEPERETPGERLAPLFIHIGAHKAGSSTIQGFMFEHEKLLAKHGILYPKFGRAPRGAHHKLPNSLGKRPDPGRVQKDWRRIRQARKAAAPGQRMMLSAEGFENLGLEQIRQVKELAGGGAIRILYYIRDLGGGAVAAYGQRTKIGTNHRNFDEFFERNIERMAEGRLEVVRSWAAVFGIENIRVRALDPQVLTGGDLMDDVLHIIGSSRETLGVPPAPRRNVSPGWKMTETLREVWRLLAAQLGEKGRKRLAPRFVNAVDAAAAKYGSDTDRGEYLTLEQRRICDELSAKVAAEINAMQPEAGLQVVPAAAARERPFLPSIEHVPSTVSVPLITQVMTILLTDPALRERLKAEDLEPEEDVAAVKRTKRQAARKAREAHRTAASAAAPEPEANAAEDPAAAMKAQRQAARKARRTADQAAAPGEDANAAEDPAAAKRAQRRAARKARKGAETVRAAA